MKNSLPVRNATLNCVTHSHKSFRYYAIS